jgi:hypothetical protein
MQKDNPIEAYASILKDLVAWFKKSRVKGTIIGGVASSLIGKPRFTKDIDAVIMLDSEKGDEFLKTGEDFGFYPRISDALDFARKRRIFLLKHRPSGVPIDVSLGALPFEEEMIKRCQFVKSENTDIPICSPEDLIILKAVSHRSQDLADIQSVLEAQKKLDLKRIRHWVTEFSKVLEMPEILEDVEKLIRGARKR